MHVYHAKVFKSSTSGLRVESVVCEKCATTFSYELVRVGAGTASAPYYIGQTAAKARADQRARADLQKRLAREAELVPCPKCHWVNDGLIERVRRRRYLAAVP